jgi:hypothetical protein
MLTLPASLGCVFLAQPWYRIHQARYEAVFFGKSKDSRFDDPRQAYGVLYAAQNIQGAIVETLYPPARRAGNGPFRIVPRSFVYERALAVVFFERPLKLVDLTSSLARFGTSASEAASPDRQITQGWSRQLYEHPDQPDGILYFSQFAPMQRCVAVFDRIGAVRMGSLLLSDPIVRQFLDEAHDLHGLRIDPAT